MRSERDAGKKPNEEGEGGTYRLVPPREEMRTGSKTWGE